MKFIKSIKDFLYKCDFFYSTELLRYKTEPEYRTLFGGVMSLIIIISLILTFYSKLIDTINKVVITSTSNNMNAADPGPFIISTFPQNKFMFGVQIWHHDLNTGNRYFDVVLTSVQLDTGQRRNTSLQYPLEPCTLNHWEGFPQIQKDYERLKMNHWLCLPKNMQYNIQGKYASEFSQTLQVAVKKCTNNFDINRPCADLGKIETYFAQNQSFFFTIYFLNPLINPTSEKYLTYYLEDNNYIIFTKSLGAQGILFIEEYSITTDESILPFAKTHQNQGGIVTEFALKNPYEVTNDVYCSFAFFKSGIATKYERNFQKLDEILSYIGGLFGTIAIFLFVVNAYNGHSFQITLGGYLFHSSNQKQGNKYKKYNFLFFIFQGIYSVFNSIGVSLKWKSIRDYFNCREEMVKQLDVLYLLKRVFFLEKTMNILFEQHQLKGLHLQQKMTLEQAKKIRQNFNIKRKFIKTCLHIKNQQQNQNNKPTLTEESISSCQKNLTVLNKTQSISGKNSDNFNSMEANIVSKDLSDKLKQQNQEQKDILLSEQSDSDSQNELQIGNDITKLKIQADKGNTLSKKIWAKIDQNMKYSLQNLIKKHKEFDILDQQKNKSNQIKIKADRFSQNNLTNEYKISNHPKLNKQKIKMRVLQKYPKESKFYQNWINNIEQTDNVILQDEMQMKKKTSF